MSTVSVIKQTFLVIAMLAISAVASIAAECNYNGKLPDMVCTPGAINPAVTQDNIKTTICVPGYSKKVRPSTAVTNKIKIIVMKKYGDKSKAGSYELDHLISLELGGCPDCVTNLWPQAYLPKPGAREKDKVEDDLHKKVCKGEITLREAQQIILKDWYSYYKNMIKGKN